MLPPSLRVFFTVHFVAITEVDYVQIIAFSFSRFNLKTGPSTIHGLSIWVFVSLVQICRSHNTQYPLLYPFALSSKETEGSGSKERRPTKKYLNWRVEPKCSNSRRAWTRMLQFYLFTFGLIVHTVDKSQDRCCCCS